MKRITYLLICVISLIGGGCTNLLETNSELLGNVVTKVERLDTLEVTLEVAGTLAEKIGDKKDVISKLIVSGPFDADDVTTMKALPKLQSIDMKGVIIVGGDKTYNSWYKLEDNVIGKFMFGNLSSFLLEELILPTTIIAIDDEAFRGMYNLKSLDIPDGVNVIGTCAFASCSGLESITLPSKLKVIEAETFQDCAKLSFILLPEKLIAIKQYAFYNCRSIETVVIPENVNEIGDNAFGCCEQLNSVTLPSQLRKISNSTFSRCVALEQINFPSTLTSIGEHAFEYCSALNTIDFPQTLTTIGEKAFGASGLTTITLPENLKKIGTYAFNACDELLEANLPEKLESLGDLVFWHCDKLRSVTLPTNIETLSPGLFSECISLSKVELPKSLKRIGGSAFDGSGLAEISLPEGLLQIDEKAFCRCNELRTITIPHSVTLVGGGVFSQCFKLHSIFWNTSAVFPNVYSYNVGGNRAEGGNMNCLLYLADENTQIDDKEWKNIIINGEADQIVLSSVRPYPFNTTGNFYCPQAFKALKISYSRNFSSLTYPNEPAGWESISLPFTPTQIKHEDGRVLAPFNSGNDNTKPFWLRRLTANGFENVTSFEANVPYIIAMPNNEKYAAEYNIAGTVIFSAENATNGILIPATTDLSKEEGPSFRFCSNYERIPKNAATYVLHKDYDSHKTGSMFVRSERDALPFEAYVATKNISAKAPAMFSVNSSVNTRSNRTIGGKPDIDDM